MSYTDVMAVRGSARRTFFHDRGANARLGPEHFDFTGANARIFYLGYLLLLDRLDAPGIDGAPVAKEVLRKAGRAGLVTALDCVSAAGDHFRAAVAPVLPEVDVLFVNDYEAEQVARISLGREARARPARGRGGGPCARRIRGPTVGNRPFSGGRMRLLGQGEVYGSQPSRSLPSSSRARSAPATPWPRSVLFGLHEGWPISQALELGACTAAASLMSPTCSAGIMASAECLSFGREQGFAVLP